MAKWKTKSPKKLSVRERKKLADVADLEKMEEEAHCRFGFDMGIPCRYLCSDADCLIDVSLCDLETEKGRAFLEEYENYVDEDDGEF